MLAPQQDPRSSLIPIAIIYGKLSELDMTSTGIGNFSDEDEDYGVRIGGNNLLDIKTSYQEVLRTPTDLKNDMLNKTYWYLYMCLKGFILAENENGNTWNPADEFHPHDVFSQCASPIATRRGSIHTYGSEMETKRSIGKNTGLQKYLNPNGDFSLDIQQMDPIPHDLTKLTNSQVADMDDETANDFNIMVIEMVMDWLYNFSSSEWLFKMDSYYYLDLILLSFNIDTLKVVQRNPNENFQNQHGVILSNNSSVVIENLLHSIYKEATGHIKRVFYLF